MDEKASQTIECLARFKKGRKSNNKGPSWQPEPFRREKKKRGKVATARSRRSTADKKEYNNNIVHELTI